jgi:ankyrin repeat protein
MHINSNTVCENRHVHRDYFSSAQTGDIDTVKYLLRKYPGGYWIIQNENGISSMQLAAQHGQTAVLKAFVDEGGVNDLNIPTADSDWEIPLNLAYINNNHETVHYIVSHGYSRNVQKTTQDLREN